MISTSYRITCAAGGLPPDRKEVALHNIDIPHLTHATHTDHTEEGASHHERVEPNYRGADGLPGGGD